MSVRLSARNPNLARFWTPIFVRSRLPYVFGGVPVLDLEGLTRSWPDFYLFGVVRMTYLRDITFSKRCNLVVPKGLLLFRGSLNQKKRRVRSETRFCDFWSFPTVGMDPNALRTGLWCFGVGAKSSGHLEVFGKTLLFWGKN